MNHPEEKATSKSLPLPPLEGAVCTLSALVKTHTCLTYGKSFSSHQALGSHISSCHINGKATSAWHNDQSANNDNITIPASAGAFQER